MTIKIEVTTELIISLYNRLNSLFPWQKRWYAQRFQRARNLHKGRQIGADYYFALEAVLDACLTGRNKIFIEPAPSEQEDIFISNVAGYAAVILGIVRMPGSKEIVFDNGAVIRFLPENNHCWAVHLGDVYVSEWAWFTNPDDIVKIVMAMTAHEKWRRTYYSSRGEGDNGNGVVFSEKSSFYDVVPLLPHECGTEHFLKIGALHGDNFYPRNLINELYLCQLPEGSKSL